MEYIHWIHNFLSSIDSPVVMFSEGDMLQAMIQMRKEAKLEDRFFPIEKPFDQLKFSTSEWIQIWEKQVEKSNFRQLHNHQLYRIWANKSFFVEEAIQKNPFQSDFFVWCDAGCWRDQPTAQILGPSWPVPEKGVPNRLHILAMSPIQPWIEKTDVLPADSTLTDIVEKIPTRFVAIVSGTILAGDKAAWQSWIPIFEQTLQAYIEKDLFAGDDQAVITSTALWLHKIDSSNKPIFYKAPAHRGFLILGGWPIGDPWFAFQAHFSKIDFMLDTY